MNTILTAFVRNHVFANIILVLIFLVGVLATKSMVRETFPQFSADWIVVTVAYPGADPEEVEEGISRKIEEALEDVEGIKEYGTDSRENVGVASILVKEGYEVAKVLDKVRNRIDAISTLPVDAERPVIEEMVIKDPVIMLGLTSNMPEKRMKEWAERIKDEIQQLADVSQVDVYGTRPYEIGIELSEAKLREYNLSFNDVVDAVRRSSVTLSGGNLLTTGEEIRVRTVGRKYTGAELASVVVLARPTGEVVTLDRLGHIVDGFTQDPIIARVNGKAAVFLSIMKTTEEDALKIAAAVNRFVSSKRSSLPDGSDIATIYDWSEMLNARINLLVRNGLIGLGIVFILLWMFLDLRLSFWAGMGMPISVSGALGVLWAVGGTINMISLFGLIMVLGIIVDDAIVVGEAIYVHRSRGEPPVQAAVAGVREVGLPVIAAVLTTIVAFIPLMFVGGIMGKFIAILPVVVIACLAVSLLECLSILPAHLGNLKNLVPDLDAHSRNPFKQFANGMHRLTGNLMQWVIDRPYTALLKWVIHYRYFTVSFAILILIAMMGMVAGGILKFQLFPSFDGFVMTAVVEFPDGTPVDVTRKAVTHLEESIERVAARYDSRDGDSIIQYRLALIGQAIGILGQEGAHIGSVQVVLVDAEDRDARSHELLLDWEKETGTIPGTEAISFSEMEAGPPGAAIEIWLQGERIDRVLAASSVLQDALKGYGGVYQVQSDYRLGRSEIRLQLKPEARALGLTVNDLATQVYAGYFGAEAARIQRGPDDIRVRVRYAEAERQHVADLDKIRIRTPDKREIPLLSVATLSYGSGFTSINRKNGMRNVAVTAEVDPAAANAREIVQSLESGILNDIPSQFPGVFVSVQGEKKRTMESFTSLRFGFPLALLGIYIIVATIFRSYVQPLVILLTVPFGMIGALLGHLLMGIELSIMSMFGMIALTGVVVNDAIVLIESVNRHLSEGLPCFDAIGRGGRRRFRPVLLTSLSTVGGLTPLIIEKDFQAQFLIPMALSIASGVAFGTLVTLVFIPAVLAILNDVRCLLYFVRHRTWPAREAVEPAAHRLSENGNEAEAHS